MLKNRLIPCIIIKDRMVVQSYNFKYYLPIGKIDAAIEFFVNWDVDEIVILDISATKENRVFNSYSIRNSLFKCFIPVTIGGGVRSLSDVQVALDSGADKVSINTAMFNDPDFIKKAALKYGSSCITISIDVKRENKEHMVYVSGGTIPTKLNVVDYVKRAEDLGAGEIFLTSIDNDGARVGYDLELLNKVTSNVSIPVIACGGVGKVRHLAEGITKGNCQAVSAANIFQHTEHSTIAAKSILKSMNLNIRLNSEVKYNNFSFDHLDRPI